MAVWMCRNVGATTMSTLAPDSCPAKRERREGEAPPPPPPPLLSAAVD
jgi:hypothetical protein